MCERCNDTGWRDPIGPCADGSYVTSRPCNCEAYDNWVRKDYQTSQEMLRKALGKQPETRYIEIKEILYEETAYIKD